MYGLKIKIRISTWIRDGSQTLGIVVGSCVFHVGSVVVVENVKNPDTVVVYVIIVGSTVVV